MGSLAGYSAYHHIRLEGVVLAESQDNWECYWYQIQNNCYSLVRLLPKPVLLGQVGMCRTASHPLTLTTLSRVSCNNSPYICMCAAHVSTELPNHSLGSYSSVEASEFAAGTTPNFEVGGVLACIST